MSFRRQEKSVLENQLDECEREFQNRLGRPERIRKYWFPDLEEDRKNEKLNAYLRLRERLEIYVHEAVDRDDPNIPRLRERAVNLYNEINAKVDELEKQIGDFIYPDNKNISHLHPYKNNAHDILWLSERVQKIRKFIPDEEKQVLLDKNTQWHFHHNLL